jgi:hypothetical protein
MLGEHLNAKAISMALLGNRRMREASGKTEIVSVFSLAGKRAVLTSPVTAPTNHRLDDLSRGETQANAVFQSLALPWLYSFN